MKEDAAKTEIENAADTESKKSPWLIRLFILFSLVGLIGGGWWWWQSKHYVNTDDARIAGTMVSVSAKLPGRVVEVLVKEGDMVKKGQLLARIDTREVSAQRMQADATLAAAKAKYEENVNGARPQEIRQAAASVAQAQAGADQARASYLNADSNCQRMKQLYAEGAISALQWDNAVTARNVAQEALLPERRFSCCAASC